DLCEITSKDYYDFIIVDEFHHAAAPSYQRLLSYYEPKVLLGLTATPERGDGKDVFNYFEDRISAEIRLPEAIDRKLLSPFQYFCITDTVDLSKVKWSRKGYDIRELDNLYTNNDIR
ncbi:DEAD/DEAH box helicase family protein, partial [Clostridium saudiense]|nr:DEAD/DEAH box helicase family protein [Clostridium saudiense]